jgi:hypothetical protein
VIAATFTAEEFSRRLQNSGGFRTPQELALAKLEDVARAANKLGLAGHKVKHVEILVSMNDLSGEPKIEVRIVPDFKLRQ